MALDGDEVHDDNDGDMLCIPTTLWVNADYRHCDVLHRKDVHEEKTQDHYQYNAGEVFPELTRTSIATDRFVLLSRLPALSHDVANLSLQENCTVLQMVLLYKS